ncbi:MAG TPA: hypothetical protein PKV27_05125 [Ilumatobacteraceae bacterium]|nr:hypothetical protein [Ilumatobacteraceae bacterium]
MRIVVPASSANLGPGFDALGMALGLHAELWLETESWREPRARPVEPTHPAMVAFRAAGGQGGLRLRCPIPSGRGMGFSGAVRVAGVVAAHLQASGPDQAAFDAHRGRLLAIAADLEGHADNVAASMYGGVTVAAGGIVQRVPLGLDAAVVAWVPDSGSTSTDASRSRLPAQVDFEAAVFNVGRTALLVAALAAGNRAALGIATEDQLHQDNRLGRAAGSADALRAALASPAWAAWLSGSGPTVVALCDPADSAAVAAALPSTGRAMTLRIDQLGARIVMPTASSAG